MRRDMQLLAHERDNLGLRVKRLESALSKAMEATRKALENKRSRRCGGSWLGIVGTVADTKGCGLGRDEDGEGGVSVGLVAVNVHPCTRTVTQHNGEPYSAICTPILHHCNPNPCQAASRGLATARRPRAAGDDAHDRGGRTHSDSREPRQLISILG